MNINNLLIIVFGVSLFLFVVTVIAYQVINRRNGDTLSDQKFYRNLLAPKRKRSSQFLQNTYQKAYLFFIKVPLLKGYVRKVRKRLSSIHSYDELTMRRETMKIALITWGLVIAIVVGLIIVNQDVSFIFMVLVAAFVVNGMLVDAFINRVEDRLMKQLAYLMADVRHHYHQHGMVEEAIYEASQNAKYEASLHGERIYQILTHNNPEEALESYYEVAPNRFLKGFAGISYLTKEFGDKVVKNGSLYLNSLSKLTQEINLEILRRDKLNYLFKGLTSIAIAPILFTKPIEDWARGHFPSMNDFYAGKLGFFTKILIFTVILVSYILLRKMQENDEGKYAAKVTRNRWEKKVYPVPIVKWVVDRFVPGAHTRQYFRMTRLLKETSSPHTLEWHYLHRILLSLLCFVCTIAMFFYMHIVATQNVLYAPTSSPTLFGTPSAQDQQLAEQMTVFDRTIIFSLKGEMSQTREVVTAAVQRASNKPLSQDELNADTNRILSKLGQLNAEYFKWWELLTAIVVGMIGYFAPYALLQFNERLRKMDMQNEVDQFHTIIAMLCEIERISVENILEWMERFAAVFKAPLQICLLNYESGAWQALEQLKDEAPFVPFIRTVERLQLATEKIPIREAFDDLETERMYYQEQRKEHYARTIESKSSWGKMIGFVPLYALVFLYLVAPLIYMSFTQMGTYFTQIQHLH